MYARNSCVDGDKSSRKLSEVLIANSSRFSANSLFLVYNFVTRSLKVPGPAFILVSRTSLYEVDPRLLQLLSGSEGRYTESGIVPWKITVL